MRWEYRTIPLIEHPGLVPPRTITEDLNMEGQLGWELVGTLEQNRGYPLAILKRPLAEDLVSDR